MHRKLTENFLHASIPSEPSLLNIFWQAVVWTAINEDMFQDSEYSKLTAVALDGQAELSVYSTSKPQKRRSTAKSMMNLSIDFRSHFIAEVFQMESFKLWSWPCHTYYYSITQCVFIVSYSFMTKLRVNVLLLTPESTVEIDRNNCIWNYGSKYLLYIRHGSHCSVLHKTKRNIFFRIFLSSFFAGSPFNAFTPRSH